MKGGKAFFSFLDVFIFKVSVCLKFQPLHLDNISNNNNWNQQKKKLQNDKMHIFLFL